jgi:hypothetical protein
VETVEGAWTGTEGGAGAGPEGAGPEGLDTKSPVDDAADGPSVWIVLRQDDNGNIYPVGRYPTAAEARAVAAQFEARAHKQIYWAERATD